MSFQHIDQSFGSLVVNEGGLSVGGPVSLSGALVTPYQYAVPLTGATVTASATAQGLIINPAADLAALTVVLPTSPRDGQVFAICTSRAVATLTVTGTLATGNALAALVAGTPVNFIYSSTASAWFKA